MISEKEMEDLIVKNPKRFIDEHGLQLISRQFKIGNYIFDLLFEDRFGTKLIVEIQRGTLDRNHTYKILDYYDEFKEKNPGYIFGCDICQNVCPHNKNTSISKTEDFSPERGVGGYISRETIKKHPNLLFGTSLKRIKNNV